MSTVVDSTVALVTLGDVHDYMALEPGSNDGILMRLINTVSADAMTRCGRAFLQQTRTDEKYDGDGTDTLILRHGPVTAVTKLIAELNGAQLVQGADKDYVFYPNRIVKLVNGGYFPIGRQSVTVSYTAGYSIATVPHDLKTAILEGIAFRWNTRDKRREGITSVTTADGITTYTEKDYPGNVLSTFARYARNSIRGAA